MDKLKKSQLLAKLREPFQETSGFDELLVNVLFGGLANGKTADKGVTIMSRIYKTKYYAVNKRKRRINPKPYNRAGEIKSAFTSPDVIPVKGDDLLKCTAFEYYRMENLT